MAKWEDKVAADIRAAYPGEADELLNHKTISYSGKTITLAFQSYPDWLKLYDEKRVYELKVSLNSYRAQRQKHFDDTSKVLDDMFFLDVGAALQDEILATGKRLFIKPYLKFRENAFQASAHALGESADENSKGMPILDKDGRPTGGSGTGSGTDAVVSFTPHYWGPKGTSGRTDPGFERDEVLFHECVHAARKMRGVVYRLAVNQGYDNEEEYIAVVLSNIYLSEKGQQVLRASHEGAYRLDRPERFLDNIQGVNLAPLTLIRRFQLSQPRFYRALADIGKTVALFNPVREFNDRWKSGRLKFT